MYDMDDGIDIDELVAMQYEESCNEMEARYVTSERLVKLITRDDISPEEEQEIIDLFFSFGPWCSDILEVAEKNLSSKQNEELKEKLYPKKPHLYLVES